jgi:adenine-specific DNA-methyltransferase
MRRSAYNHRATATEAYAKLLDTLDSRFVLTSYSTDGTIPLADLIAAACRHGRTVCVRDAYKRYRVSAQRPSPKPLTVEFVLVTDTGRRGRAGEAGAILETLTRTEAEALARHPETRG